MHSLSVTYEDVVQAQQRMLDTLPATPMSVLSCPKINHKVHLKLDILQRTGSFKERGALNALLQIQAEGKTQKVIGASAGNHAQAVSYHGYKLGMEVSMIMPTHTPINKVLSTQKWGAHVELLGDTVDQGITMAKERAQTSGEAFVHAFDDPRIIAGQGVCALEILQQLQHVDYIVVPIGGGGYISGIATVIKHVSPKTKVIGVQTESYPHIARAYQGKPFQADPKSSTIADGIAVKGIGEHTLPIIQALVDEIVLVNDQDIAQAILYLLQNRKILAEGAGATGFAAILSEKIIIPEGKTIVTPICGGNIDMNLLSRIIEKGFLREKRLLKVNVVISDRPGSLHQLTGVLASVGANILNIQHDRVSTNIPFYNTGTELILETKGEEHADQIIKALETHCYRVKVRT
ncbi:MAG: threonine ammonia-lyase [Deltaproteobacteria bacterium]|nr:threonine ammonia-lyase [Deltaproteobacteria bacterium]